MNIRDIKPEFRKSIVDLLTRFRDVENVPAHQLSLALLHEAYIFMIANWDMDTWSKEETTKAINKVFVMAKEEVSDYHNNNRSIH
tara:strand:- start:2774 stop:3028 length:255 start_codon:yes stop_codon:yes gene_type:complete